MSIINLKLYKINLYEEVFSKGESMGNTIARLEFMGVNNITQERLRNNFREFIDKGNRISNRISDKEFFQSNFPQIVWVSKRFDHRNIRKINIRGLFEKIEKEIGCKCFFNRVGYDIYSDRFQNSIEVQCENEEQSSQFSFYWNLYREEFEI